jgi:hypothetical protein
MSIPSDGATKPAPPQRLTSNPGSDLGRFGERHLTLVWLGVTAFLLRTDLFHAAALGGLYG